MGIPREGGLDPGIEQNFEKVAAIFLKKEFENTGPLPSLGMPMPRSKFIRILHTFK